MNITLTDLQEADLPFVKEIYDYYSLHTNVVYSVHQVSIEEIKSFMPVGDPIYRSFLLKNKEEETVGFCYFSRFKPREAFRISVELTIYLKPEFTGRRYGYEIMEQIEPFIKQGGFSNIMALISGDNDASKHLFEKCGYECCANIKQVAEKFEKKLDLMMYQKFL
ncbi:N-acetyltransferase family protein [uncultured Bacteroides sp.]|uniref:GNAT family N-acetyltransferase n=1 Tax=uncultured Bacteroides sp. TaxID=162156 RepID=UPI002AA867BB|nr:N-acetyltransferase family protein [uncultured Bacteroides sp.]